MKKYRKIPVVIEAIQWTAENREEVEKFIGAPILLWDDMRSCIETDTGKQILKLGNFVIKDIDGKFYPCGSVKFKKLYTEITEKKAVAVKDKKRVK